MAARPLSGDVLVASARSGHGATTIAGAIGNVLHLPVRGRNPSEIEWIWGPQLVGPIGAQVLDVGDISAAAPHLETVAVLRGPCLLGVRALMRAERAFDHLVVIHEPWRALGLSDVERALGVPVGATVPYSARVGRLIDTGMLRHHASIPEFDELRAWARNEFGTRHEADTNRG